MQIINYSHLRGKPSFTRRDDAFQRLRAPVCPDMVRESLGKLSSSGIIKQNKQLEQGHMEVDWIGEVEYTSTEAEDY